MSCEELFDSGDPITLLVIVDREEQIKERVEGVVFAEELDKKLKSLPESDSKRKISANGDH